MSPTPQSSSDSPEHRTPERRRPTLFEFVRRRFFAGLITLIPLLVTIYAISLLMGVITWMFGESVRPIVENSFELWGWERKWVQTYVVPVATATLSLLIATAFIVAVGELTRWFVVRKLIHTGERILERIPLIRFFYRTPKEVIKLLTENRSSAKRVVLVEYPRHGVWALAYATGEILHEPDGQLYVTVFMPTTPNPTTGFLMLVPAEQVRDFNVTAEDSFRMIISGGILSPNRMTTQVFSGMDTLPNLPPPVPLTADTHHAPVSGQVEPEGEEVKS